MYDTWEMGSDFPGFVIDGAMLYTEAGDTRWYIEQVENLDQL